MDLRPSPSEQLILAKLRPRKTDRRLRNALSHGKIIISSSRPQQKIIISSFTRPEQSSFHTRPQDLGRLRSLPQLERPETDVLAVITAKARKRSKTFLTESGSFKEDIELYPNYGNEVRRKLAENSTVAWPPSPIIQVWHH